MTWKRKRNRGRVRARERRHKVARQISKQFLKIKNPPPTTTRIKIGPSFGGKRVKRLSSTRTCWLEKLAGIAPPSNKTIDGWAKGPSKSSHEGNVGCVSVEATGRINDRWYFLAGEEIGVGGGGNKIYAFISDELSTGLTRAIVRTLLGVKAKTPETSLPEALCVGDENIKTGKNGANRWSMLENVASKNRHSTNPREVRKNRGP